MLLQAGQTMQSWGPHARRVLQLLAVRGPASREQLHRMTGLHRALVTTTVRQLIDDGLVRLGDPQVRGSGRPQTPLLVDSKHRTILGVAIQPRMVSACRVGLTGQAINGPTTRTCAAREHPLEVAAELIQTIADSDTLAIGVSVTGVLDPRTGSVLESSALPDAPVDTTTLRSAAGEVPLVLENDLHALAQHWRLNHEPAADEDVLLVRLEDGAVAASLIVDGRTHVGCIGAANELGHTRMMVETRRCYCGHRGCLERIFDSRFAEDQDGRRLTLERRLAASGRLDPVMTRIADLLGLGIANALHLTKPHRLVLVSDPARATAFRRRLLSSIRRETLRSLRDHVRLEWWDGPTCVPAAVAAFPALALVFQDAPNDTESVRRCVG